MGEDICSRGTPNRSFANCGQTKTRSINQDVLPKKSILLEFKHHAWTSDWSKQYIEEGNIPHIFFDHGVVHMKPVYE